jgi:hypothetical protein
MKQARGVILIAALTAAVCLFLGMPGAAGQAAQADPATFACAPEGKHFGEFCPEVQVTEFYCFFAPYKKVKSLHFKVTLKNVSQEPQRYRVNIFLDNGKAVGGLVPRKVKKGLVEPGKTASFTYPIKGMDSKPGSVTVLVKTVGK